MQSLQSLVIQLERSPEWQSSALLRQVLARWPQVVGAAVAQHTQPTKIFRSTLQVSVSSAAWAQTLMFERPRVLEKLYQSIPAARSEIQDLRFATATWQRTQGRSPHTSTAPPHEHPSWIKNQSQTVIKQPQTVDEAFQQWASLIQARFTNQAHCQQCDRPCPTQELQRWGMCAICVTQKWHQ